MEGRESKEKDYWYPWAPAALRRDAMHLSEEQELIYRRIIDFYMETSKGPLLDNDQALANIARFPIDRFLPHAEVIKKFFKKCGKNKDLKSTGFLLHTRCEANLADQVKRAEKNRNNGKNGGRPKGSKNNGEKPSGNPKETTEHNNTIEKDTDVSFSPAPEKERVSSQTKADVAAAFSMWNEMAERNGLPKAQRLNAARERKLTARLRDAGGLEGWAAALEKTAESDFCSGRKTDFKAGLDFLLQESSFTKLMEGNYDNNGRQNGPRAAAGPGNNASAGQGRPRSTYDAGMEGFSRAADKHARNRAGNGDMGGAESPDAPGDLFAQGKSRAGQG